MQTIILDCPEECDHNAPWAAFDALGPVRRYRSTTLTELLERGRSADVLVSLSFPLRREVLDYLTRPKLIAVPQGRRADLVELSVAQQLGIVVVGFAGLRSVDPIADPSCSWIPPLVQAIQTAFPGHEHDLS